MNVVKLVTGKWLEEHGFQFIEDEAKIEYAAFDVYVGDGLIYLETSFERQAFCVVIEQFEYSNGQPYDSVCVWVQENIGCGWVELPIGDLNISTRRFEMIFEGIRGEKLPNT